MSQKSCMPKVPFFNIDFGVEEKVAVNQVLDSGWLTMGETTRRFEEKFAEFVGVRYAVAVCNGTAAVHLAHRALDIGEGDEVICPSLTFVAGANAIMYCRAKPVFADIVSEDDLTICPEQIEAKITGSTRAIQIMHYGGHCCNMEAITEIAGHHQLYIIEDCCHSPGVFSPAYSSPAAPFHRSVTAMYGLRVIRQSNLHVRAAGWPICGFKFKVRYGSIRWLPKA